MTRPVVLLLGGIDPSGGAGLVADIQTVTALGAHPAPVVSLVTVQNTKGVAYAEPVRSQLVADQSRAVMEDMDVAAIKLGALGSAEVGRTVGRLIAPVDVPVVTDPVLAATAGGALAESELLDVYRELILPNSTLATPNRREFEVLGGEAEVERWLAHGLGACLVSGGDSEDHRIRHVLYSATSRREIEAGPRLPGVFRGTGCTFASAVAARLAMGDALAGAIEHAESFVREALSQAFAIGMGVEVPGRW